MTKGPLFAENGNGNFVSPLVDVVMNLMITFFVFLMIYMAVVLPDKYEPPKFVPSGQTSANWE